MVNTDNIIPFPVPKPKTHFVDLVDFVVYSDRGYLVTACYCLDCKIVHICGHQPTGNDMYEMVEELASRRPAKPSTRKGWQSCDATPT